MIRRSSIKVRPKALVQDLQYLRMVFRESLEFYKSRIEGELSKVMEAVEKLEKPNSSRSKSPSIQKDIQEMYRAIQKIHLKPRKGRRKDLRGIEKIAADCFNRIQDW